MKFDARLFLAFEIKDFERRGSLGGRASFSAPLGSLSLSEICSGLQQPNELRERSEIIREGGMKFNGGSVMIFCALKKVGLQFFRLSFVGGL